MSTVKPPMMADWLARTLLCMVSGTVWAQTPEPVLVYPGEHMPTRMVLCQREVLTEQADRQRLMRACLARRLEGERVIERQCSRQAAGGGSPAARHAAQRDCERQALTVSFRQLPRQPLAPPPRLVSVPAPTPEKVAPAFSMPMAGDQ